MFPLIGEFGMDRVIPGLQLPEKESLKEKTVGRIKEAIKKEGICFYWMELINSWFRRAPVCSSRSLLRSLAVR